MDEQLLNNIVHLNESKANCSQILNPDLPPILQNSCVSSPNAIASHLFISGISDVLDTHHKYSTPVYALVNRNDQCLPIPQKTLHISNIKE
jgi:hypothetical protein